MKVSAAFQNLNGLKETCKTLRLRISAKFRIHLIDSLIKLNRISEVFHWHYGFFGTMRFSFDFVTLFFEGLQRFPFQFS